ncbi:MAG: glyceraldehyde-3-phosphate dehydrogenase [Planctomycetes bacterium SM23_65]|nr:MAG: glyceraldehyde-3-phosphate dehydrogenase [Planctomycetes bacterium SM23_65]
MAVKVAINGFGRIGRLVFRAMADKKNLEVVHINDLMDASQMAMLLKYDSVHGRFSGRVEADDDALVVNGTKIPISTEKDPANLPWKEKGVEIVLESTGVFRTRDLIAKHLDAGAKKVLLSVPAKDEIDATVVRGVNCQSLKPEDRIVSNASCTTNCLAPMAKVLSDSFGIESGLMTTIHSYTNDQRILDFPHKDMRRGRTAAANIIPTTTGAAKAIGKVIPELDGKLNGMAMRVPTPDGSIVDLVAVLSKPTTVKDVNAAMKKASETSLKGIMEYTEDPIVVTDIVGNPHSCVFDAPSTMMIGDKLVKVIGWYDNEWAYSVRCVELMEMMAG